MPYHGLLIGRKWDQPQLVVECNEEARPGYKSCKANEYVDIERVMDEKVELLWKMIKQSKNMVVYTGAGLSTAAGINDYGTKSNKSIATPQQRIHPYHANPTLSHHILKQLVDANILKKWIQQNHDGLPQKAGVPQHILNEIHGSWFEGGANPVVPMSGELRDDLFQDMLNCSNETDLVLAVGTSLAGMNADRVAQECGKRFVNQTKGQGLVIIGLQETKSDEYAALKIYGLIDVVFNKLHMLMLKENIGTQITSLQCKLPPKRDGQIFIVPYDHNGNYSKEKHKTIFQLEPETLIQITRGPHKNCYGRVKGQDRQGHYNIQLQVKKTKQSQTHVLVMYKLGYWWPYEAEKGTAPYLPLISISN